VPLLDDVTEAAERYRRAEEERQQAREQLRARVRAARDEGISFAAIARAAGISRERVRQLYTGR
jgi:DNA-directed RNA polymerase sigma subunit (sigma70/sigma32)